MIANLYQIFLQDGFGFHIGKNVKKPQELRVQIGDDVEIGSNTTIDREAGEILLLIPIQNLII